MGCFMPLLWLCSFLSPFNLLCNNAVPENFRKLIHAHYDRAQIMTPLYIVVVLYIYIYSFCLNCKKNWRNNCV